MFRVRRQISLRRILVWMTILGFLVVVGASLVIYVRANEVKQATRNAIEVYQPAADSVANLTLANSEMERGVSLYALGGTEVALLPYVGGERSSALELEALQDLLGGNSEVSPLLDRVAQAREQWLTEIAKPTISAVRSGDPQAANSIMTGARSQETFDELVISTSTLSNDIDSARTATFLQIAALTNQFIIALIASAVIILVAMGMAIWAMTRWVLQPLRSLSREMQEASQPGSHDHPITPDGPRELNSVGEDAERMRRQLVAEIDEARSARQALEHRAPLVTAIRRELAMPVDPGVPGLRVHGEVQPAEGVLAGDWWDSVAMPSGHTALIITDVSGHGPESGVVAMRVKHLLAQSLATGSGPEQALDVAAASFADDEDLFATVAVVCIDPATGSITWANAGHHAPLLLEAAGPVRELGQTGPLLSWIGGSWSAANTRLGAGDYLVLFSDGLTESHDSSGAQLGVEGLTDLLRPLVGEHLAPDEVVQRTLAQARVRAADWDRDDVTLVAATPARVPGRPLGAPGSRGAAGSASVN